MVDALLGQTSQSYKPGFARSARVEDIRRPCNSPSTTTGNTSPPSSSQYKLGRELGDKKRRDTQAKGAFSETLLNIAPSNPLWESCPDPDQPLLPPFVEPTPSRSLFERIASYIGSYFDAEPAIVEYSDYEIAQQVGVRIEAERIKSSDLAEGGRVICIVGLVTNNIQASGGSRTASIEIRARYKRVKEILIDEGFGYMVEQVYKIEIANALRGIEHH